MTDYLAELKKLYEKAKDTLSAEDKSYYEERLKDLLLLLISHIADNEDETPDSTKVKGGKI